MRLQRSQGFAQVIGVNIALPSVGTFFHFALAVAQHRLVISGQHEGAGGHVGFPGAVAEAFHGQVQTQVAFAQGRLGCLQKRHVLQNAAEDDAGSVVARHQRVATPPAQRLARHHKAALAGPGTLGAHGGLDGSQQGWHVGGVAILQYPRPVGGFDAKQLGELGADVGEAAGTVEVFAPLEQHPGHAFGQRPKPRLVGGQLQLCRFRSSDVL